VDAKFKKLKNWIEIFRAFFSGKEQEIGACEILKSEIWSDFFQIKNFLYYNKIAQTNTQVGQQSKRT
jgi:hypothetical protein